MRFVGLISLAAFAALAGCDRPHDSAWYNRGGPNMLLDVSNEVVNLSVAGPAEIAQLTQWVQEDVPTRAELYCDASAPNCRQARAVLESRGVPVMQVSSFDQSVALVYERILARDCNSRFVDNHNNNYNAPHPSLGCSVSANLVQHVSDKQQFVNPHITDTPRATGGIMAYERAYAPPSGNSRDIRQSLVQSSQSE